MRRGAVAAVLLFSAVRMAPATAGDRQIVGVAVPSEQVRSPWEVPASWQLPPPWEVPVNPGMDNAVSNASDPPLNLCCRFNPVPCSQAPGTYPVGTTIVANSYWSESIITPQPTWNVTFTAGVRTVGGQVIIFVDNETFTFNNVPAGNVTFCIGVTGTLPPAAVPASPIQTGFRVTTPGGTVGPAVYNSFTATP